MPNHVVRFSGQTVDLRTRDFPAFKRMQSAMLLRMKELADQRKDHHRRNIGDVRKVDADLISKISAEERRIQKGLAALQDRMREERRRIRMARAERQVWFERVFVAVCRKSLPDWQFRELREKAEAISQNARSADPEATDA